MNGNKEHLRKVEAGVWLLREQLCRKGFGEPDGHFGLPNTKQTSINKRAAWRSTKVVSKLKYRCCKKRLSEWALFSLEKRRLWGDLVAAFLYYEKIIEKMEPGLHMLHGSTSLLLSWLLYLSDVGAAPDLFSQRPLLQPPLPKPCHANIMPIFKVSKKEDARNYRSRILVEATCKHLKDKKVIGSTLHSFTKAK
ncbi:hypothetical protein QYF61_015298 [Mycteria americana]|uniref:Uncharacterized protein n=1 Tax=Mycteria americana TaxID=33587 RepID=A0AAN7PII0_MYCAM|nr:hypothetical protein QYF61_015298 [Mycteria americana]